MATSRKNPPGKDTTLPVAKIASKLLKDPGSATKREIKTVAAAALGGTIPKKNR